MSYPKGRNVCTPYVARTALDFKYCAHCPNLEQVLTITLLLSYEFLDKSELLLVGNVSECMQKFVPYEQSSKGESTLAERTVTSGEPIFGEISRGKT